MLPITVVDDFFETPSLIRDYALSLPFSKSYDGVCPGVRTDYIFNIDPEFHNFLVKKVISLFYNLDKETFEVDIEFNFQQSYAKYEEGWVHQDSRYSQFAGVVYLTPNAPPEAGTSIYKLINPNYDEKQELKFKFYGDEDVSLEEVRKAREKNNACFQKSVDISNVYNRLIVYNSRDFHKENMFFGNDKNDCRLTLLFFGSIKNKGSTQSPVIRSKFNSRY